MSKLAAALPRSRGMPAFFDPEAGGSACYLRRYTARHLSEHPAQQVMAMGLALYPEASDQVILNLYVRLRPGNVRVMGSAYCDQDGEGLDCRMEGDAGRFSLTGAKNGALRLSVAPAGVSFEGEAFHTLDGTRGDDRVFLLPPVGAQDCGRLLAAGEVE